MNMKMNLADSYFLTMESRQCPMHVSGLLIFQIPENYKGNYTADLVEKLRKNHRVVAPFNLIYKRSIKDLGCPGYVVDKNFDLDYHVRHIALPKPGNMEQLNKLAAHIHGHMLDRHRPLWECHVIEGLEGNRFAVYMKFHHAQFDGVAATELIYNFLTTDPEDTTVKGYWQCQAGQWKNKKVKNSIWHIPENMMLTMANSTKVVSELTRYWMKVGSLKGFFSEDYVPFPYDAPKTLFNKNITAQRIFTHVTLPLDQIKKLGKENDSTVNDVVMAVCSGAMRKYLLDRKSLPEKSLIGFVPVALPAGENTGANNVSGVWCNLGTDIDDPKDRFHHIKKSMVKNKEMAKTLSNDAFRALPIFAVLPVHYLNYFKLGAHMPWQNMNAVISNVPGSPRSYYLYGAKVVGWFPLSALTHGNALNITLNRIENEISFGILSCRTVMPDLDFFAEGISSSFNELKDALQKGKKPKKKSSQPQKKVESNPDLTP